MLDIIGKWRIKSISTLFDPEPKPIESSRLNAEDGYLLSDVIYEFCPDGFYYIRKPDQPPFSAKWWEKGSCFFHENAAAAGMSPEDALPFNQISVQGDLLVINSFVLTLYLEKEK